MAKTIINPYSGELQLLGEGSGRPYPPIPVGSYYTPAENYTTPTTCNMTLNQYIGQMFWNEADYDMTVARMRTITAAAGVGLIGVYKLDISNNRWDLQGITAEYDNSLGTVEQIVSFISTVSLKANNFYAIGAIQSVTASITGVSVNSQRTYFGYGGNYSSSHNSALQFSHTYDGTLPATIDPPVYGTGIGAILPMIYFK